MDIKGKITDPPPAKLSYEKKEEKHFSFCSKKEFRIQPLSSLKKNQFYFTVPVERVLRRIFGPNSLNGNHVHQDQ